ncbi:MAG: hypothetical protein Q8858_06415 [Bacteroidota bacterium]|nr:hypothetical protein [Bacteroidota bacterium]
MKIILIRVVLLFSLIAFCFVNISILSHTYVYSESIEYLFPKIRFWAKNAEYKLNYFGLSEEKMIKGRKSLKMDITVLGDGDKDCFYYWIIPVSLKHYGEIVQSANIWADSNASKYVSIGLNFVYPPDSTKFRIIPQAGRWFKISDTLSQAKLTSGLRSGISDFYDGYSDGNQINRIGIFIRAKGKHQLTFYLNDIVLFGKTFNLSDFQKYLRKSWEDFKQKYVHNIDLFSSAVKPEYEVLNAANIPLSHLAERFYEECQAENKTIKEMFSEFEGTNNLNIGEMNRFAHLLSSYSKKVEIIRSEVTSHVSSRAIIFQLPATNYNRLTGSNIPEDAKPLNKLSSRVCPGQYESLSILIQPKEKLGNIKIRWSDFKGEGSILNASSLDVSIAKVWYQAGIKSTEVNNKLLTQELLLKDDKLVKVDYTTATNYLWVTKDGSNKGEYIDISSPSAKFPENVIIKDSKTLQPFTIDDKMNKQIWFTMHVPEDAKPGKYISRIVLEDDNSKIAEFPLEIVVLPFKLEQSRLTYSLYYHGALRDWKLRPFHCEDKTEEQLEIELRDMKDHGVLYPNNYQDIKHLAKNLEIRNRVGLPKDKLYSTLLDWCSGLSKSKNELGLFKARIMNFKEVAEKYGYKDLYIYGIDEARGEKLKAQRPEWEAAHEVGAKIFVAGYSDTFSDMGDLLDLGIIQGPLNKEQPALYHSIGHQVFSYSNPQVGQENPEIYRRNYGIALWKAGYDGEMDYAYQKNYGSIWNDFDNNRYREETFTYPTSDGIISTVQWEGFRQGVNDVRFLSTLLNKIDKLKQQGKKTSELEKWVNSIDPSGDLDELRNKIIDKILSVTYL